MWVVLGLLCAVVVHVLGGVAVARVLLRVEVVILELCAPALREPDAPVVGRRFDVLGIYDLLDASAASPAVLDVD